MMDVNRTSELLVAASSAHQLVLGESLAVVFRPSAVVWQVDLGDAVESLGLVLAHFGAEVKAAFRDKTAWCPFCLSVAHLAANLDAIPLAGCSAPDATRLLWLVLPSQERRAARLTLDTDSTAFLTALVNERNGVVHASGYTVCHVKAVNSTSTSQSACKAQSAAMTLSAGSRAAPAACSSVPESAPAAWSSEKGGSRRSAAAGTPRTAC